MNIYLLDTILSLLFGFGGAAFLWWKFIRVRQNEAFEEEIEAEKARLRKELGADADALQEALGLLSNERIGRQIAANLVQARESVASANVLFKELSYIPQSMMGVETELKRLDAAVGSFRKSKDEVVSSLVSAKPQQPQQQQGKMPAAQAQAKPAAAAPSAVLLQQKPSQQSVPSVDDTWTSLASKYGYGNASEMWRAVKDLPGFKASGATSWKEYRALPQSEQDKILGELPNQPE